MMNHGDVDRRTNRWWRRHSRCDEEPCEDIRRKPSVTWDVRNDDECFHGVDTVANVSLVLVDQRCHCGDATRVPQTMSQCSQRQSSASVLTRSSADFTRYPAQGPYDHQTEWGLVLHYQEKMQMHEQRQRTTWGTGMNPTGHYAHMLEGKRRKGIYPKQPRSL